MDVQDAPGVPISAQAELHHVRCSVHRTLHADNLRLRPWSEHHPRRKHALGCLVAAVPGRRRCDLDLQRNAKVVHPKKSKNSPGKNVILVMPGAGVCFSKYSYKMFFIPKLFLNVHTNAATSLVVNLIKNMPYLMFIYWFFRVSGFFSHWFLRGFLLIELLCFFCISTVFSSYHHCPVVFSLECLTFLQQCDNGFNLLYVVV